MLSVNYGDHVDHDVPPAKPEMKAKSLLTCMLIYQNITLKEVHWNLNFTFLKSMPSLRLCIFTLVPPNFHKNNVQFSWNIHLCFLPTSLIIHLIINLFFYRYHFLSPLSSLYTLTILWLYDYASREEPCFLPSPSPCRDKRCEMQVTSDHKFHVLIKSMLVLLFESTANWTSKQFCFLVTICCKWPQVPALIKLLC